MALQAGSLLASLHAGQTPVVERTTCNYGLNVDFDSIASEHGMRASGIDDLGEVRAVERTDHPFFLGTLYQPQLRSVADDPHPVFVGFVKATMEA